jgi:DNA-binding NtrC family response regulator
VQILIVQPSLELAGVWARFLDRRGMRATLAATAAEAYEALRQCSYGALVLDMEMPAGEAIAVADFATYRDPGVPIIAVTADGFFSDSAIFELIPNARGLLRVPLKLDDMAALVEHYGGRHLTEQRAAAAGA